MNKEDKAGLYFTVTVHLAVIIVLLATSLGFSIRKENGFVLDFTKYEELEKLEEEIEKLNNQLSERTDFESEEYQELIEKFTHKSEHYQMMGGANYQAELEQTLLGLGFRRDDFDRPTSEFSGGWRMRIELAKLLLSHPDILLLDEPTNHLDIESIQWLEDFLARRCSSVMLVSHDRAFLNNVTNRTIEITCGTIHDYRVKYDEYVKLRVERREQQLRAYENQQKEIAEIKDFKNGVRHHIRHKNEVRAVLLWSDYLFCLPTRIEQCNGNYS